MRFNPWPCLVGRGSSIAMSYGVGRRLLWLWRRPTAVAPFGPLAWQLPYASGAGKTNKKNNNKNPLVLDIQNPLYNLVWGT